MVATIGKAGLRDAAIGPGSLFRLIIAKPNIQVACAPNWSIPI
jgi:hypothetical protein